MFRIALGLLLALSLAACGSVDPPSERVTGVVTDVRPTMLSTYMAREITIEIRIRNTTPNTMWLLPGDFWYHPGTSGVPIQRASANVPQGNYSSCRNTPVNPGGTTTCRLYFAWTNYVAFQDLVPGTLRWSDSSGYSHPDARGSTFVGEWIGFTPPTPATP